MLLSSYRNLVNFKKPEMSIISTLSLYNKAIGDMA